MRNNMQHIRQLIDALNNTPDGEEREIIQEEIWLLEEEMEYNEDEEYKARHFNNSHDIFQ